MFATFALVAGANTTGVPVGTPIVLDGTEFGAWSSESRTCH